MATVSPRARPKSPAVTVSNAKIVESKTPPSRISLPKNNYENKITHLPVRADRYGLRMEPIAHSLAGAECPVRGCGAIRGADSFCNARVLTVGNGFDRFG